MFEYLATQTTQLGGLGWLFFLAQVAALLGGIYLSFVQSDTHPVRGVALKRLGYLLLGLGAIGVFLAAARWLNLGALTARWWFYLWAIVELIAAGYLFYYQRNVYPQQMAEYRASSRRGAPRPVQRAQAARSNGTPEPVEPRPVATTTRRDARRERKRRK